MDFGIITCKYKTWQVPTERAISVSVKYYELRTRRNQDNIIYLIGPYKAGPNLRPAPFRPALIKATQ